ncbi:L-glyceraldehyde 3-phosphate reductase [Priestia abyssalis]|uniref:L-glyceraldehyde 3-phosphate reductase n=1 Tax=Priestia abyssalis TaxID=1221450 RepID=UPI0009954D3A|nr:L-glyceraldehyde 3-phosphate reductase [Priestia abyssalis]
MTYSFNSNRYNNMIYRRCGRSGVKLPAVSLGLWHNFGGINSYENARAMLRRAFDLGITHFDLANNYGPPPGSAEEQFGRILKENFSAYRDEMFISTKAGFYMWPGPYGEWGSRKNVLASLDQSLKRMGIEYVDLFYSHRPDPETPLEETMGALDHAVRQGKALYIGLSNYNVEETKQAIDILKRLGTPCLIHQPSYSMFDRWIEDGLQELLQKEGIGSIAYKPLSGGLLTNRYLNGIPQDSRAAGASVFLNSQDITENLLRKVIRLDKIAGERGQTLAQMALAWTLRDDKVTSTLIGASRPEQIDENVAALQNLDFSQEERVAIDLILKDE